MCTSDYFLPLSHLVPFPAFKFNAAAMDRTQLQEALDSIIGKLELKNYVHSDLRSNNIMIRTNVKEKSVDLRVIDFDWAGEAGQVCYPEKWNREI